MKNKRNFKIIGIMLLITIMFFSSSVPAYAATDDYEIMPLTSQARNFNIPGGQGTLTANVWRQTIHTASGNTYQWDYQVSAVYKGSKAVEYIQTAWKAGASLKNSAGINIGVGDTSISAGNSSSWEHVTTVEKRWKNSNGAKSADYKSNIVVGPKDDYKQYSIYLTNTATVKLKGDPKPYSIKAGV